MASNDIRAYQELTGGWLPQVKAEGHPLVLLFHLLFKVLPLTAYLLYEALQPLLSEIFLNELIIALVVFDFWLTKNICGRLLVGLRWWLDEDEREIERLKVECKMNDEEQNKSVTATLFWGVQIAYLVTALVLLIINVFRMNFRNIVLSGVMAIEGGINLYCFVRCSKGTTHTLFVVQMDKLKVLQEKLGLDFTRQLFGGSLVAFT